MEMGWSGLRMLFCVKGYLGSLIGVIKMLLIAVARELVAQWLMMVNKGKWVYDATQKWIWAAW